MVSQMSKFQIISLTFKCENCNEKTKILLPIVISEEDWITTQKSLKRLKTGKTPSEIYLNM